eukprot:TRINITY_DN4144_c0_g1_i2.p1 TRINITY_DN4144_c0_g1~~TRINITY_DN4144_c0_g1_i2.p1  ORF type:complete len:457 (+),score=82.19 TRINITY_DN4144_c0_g1_i2:102-1472(+)
MDLNKRHLQITLLKRYRSSGATTTMFLMAKSITSTQDLEIVILREDASELNNYGADHLLLVDENIKYSESLKSKNYIVIKKMDHVSHKNPNEILITPILGRHDVAKYVAVLSEYFPLSVPSLKIVESKANQDNDRFHRHFFNFLLSAVKNTSSTVKEWVQEYLGSVKQEDKDPLIVLAFLQLFSPNIKSSDKENIFKDCNFKGVSDFFLRNTKYVFWHSMIAFQILEAEQKIWKPTYDCKVLSEDILMKFVQLFTMIANFLRENSGENTYGPILKNLLLNHSEEYRFSKFINLFIPTWQSKFISVDTISKMIDQMFNLVPTDSKFEVHILVARSRMLAPFEKESLSYAEKAMKQFQSSEMDDDKSIKRLILHNHAVRLCSCGEYAEANQIFLDLVKSQEGAFRTKTIQTAIKKLKSTEYSTNIMELAQLFGVPPQKEQKRDHNIDLPFGVFADFFL